jgi:hypothetical protein
MRYPKLIPEIPAPMTMMSNSFSPFSGCHAIAAVTCGVEVDEQWALK